MSLDYNRTQEQSNKLKLTKLKLEEAYELLVYSYS